MQGVHARAPSGCAQHHCTLSMCAAGRSPALVLTMSFQAAQAARKPASICLPTAWVAAAVIAGRRRLLPAVEAPQQRSSSPHLKHANAPAARRHSSCYCRPQMQQPPAQPPLRVRTITAFLELPHDPRGGVEAWEPHLAAAGAFLAAARRHLESLGYEVQTTRVATQPFRQYMGAALVEQAVALEATAARHGIALVSIGSSDDPRDLDALPALIAATRSTSCAFALPPQPDWALAQRVARAIMQVASLTGGMGCFRFASTSHMVAGVPFFPVACAGPGMRAFALGTECDALLHQAFAAAAAAASAAGSTAEGVLLAAQQQLHTAMLQHLQPLEAAALAIEAAAAATSQAAAGGGGASAAFRYLGLDSSLAPGLDTPALTASYELLGLGLGRFGGPGSLTVSGLITQVLKSLPLRLTGYCGLMLAVCEDEGLAAAAADGSITISQLLQLSAVCGCGLDTVPVPGPCLPAAGGDEAGSDAAAADACTTAAIAALVCDTNTLAHRLSKPLACRLLALPGKVAGELTGFDHPYMINSRVMDLAK